MTKFYFGVCCEAMPLSIIVSKFSENSKKMGFSPLQAAVFAGLEGSLSGINTWADCEEAVFKSIRARSTAKRHLFVEPAAFGISGGFKDE